MGRRVAAVSNLAGNGGSNGKRASLDVPHSARSQPGCDLTVLHFALIPSRTDCDAATCERDWMAWLKTGGRFMDASWCLRYDEEHPPELD